METARDVEKALFLGYKQRHKHDMDEMKMHKLMYFAQREFLVRYDEQLFSEDFEGWKYGPVLLSVRTLFRTALDFQDCAEIKDSKVKKVIEFVLNEYGKMSSWSLSMLSHEEFSWKKARRGLKASENGNVHIAVKDIKVDAVRVRFERKHGVELVY
ncbi:Uncharacterized phage-associated protein [Selenomonas ruminantium]|uniref:Uncharacterized phage-associated protein n=1 Tax=Selenomonas ruminantium TaxID=971 RepID=A0A1M6WLA4_SELRU|nr:type II toxin-antitoxin system antitoxin SocA domain-containing protein [Selenomonas ruminantium]SHK94573.1 Uncharacterized phage-associated protein [Selenomonas ruminantium]